MNNRILYEGEATPPAGGAPPTDWRATLPPEIKDSPALKDFKDIPSLAKSYVHAQSMLGVEKLPKPQPGWKDEQWADFYKNLGRPETHDKYTFKPEGMPEGVTVDEARLGEAKKALHTAGLTDKQATSVLKYYLDITGKGVTEAKTAHETAIATATAELKQEFGDKFDHKINVAKSVVQKFGSPELKGKIEEIGNDPHFIRLFASIGEAMLDDTASGSGPGLIVADPSKAMSEINQLKLDADFQTALLTKHHIGHKAAVERWSMLHEKAYPGKQD